MNRGAMGLTNMPGHAQSFLMTEIVEVIVEIYGDEGMNVGLAFIVDLLDRN